MPWCPKRACSTCGRAVNGPCPTCTKKRQQEVDARRGTAEERGYGERWRVESREWLRDPEHPERVFCADPFKLHRVRHVSEMVDHIVPHETSSCSGTGVTGSRSVGGATRSGARGSKVGSGTRGERRKASRPVGSSESLRQFAAYRA